MNYIEESTRRRELVARLKKRMMPLCISNLHTKKYEQKNFIEFGSNEEDFELLHDLIDTLTGDAFYFELEHFKINSPSNS